jgi:hypothetical protein
VLNGVRWAETMNQLDILHLLTRRKLRDGGVSGEPPLHIG